MTSSGSANFPRFRKGGDWRPRNLNLHLFSRLAPHYTSSPTSLHDHPTHSRSCNPPSRPPSALRSAPTNTIQQNLTRNTAEEMNAHAPTSRTREAPQGDEEASAELKLGEFQDVDALTHSEAALVINALVAKRSADRKNVNETEYAFSRLPFAVTPKDEKGGLGRLPKIKLLSQELAHTSHLICGSMSLGTGSGDGKGLYILERWFQFLVSHIHTCRLTRQQDALQNPRLPRSLRALQAEREC